MEPNIEITFIRHAHTFPYSEGETLCPGPGLTQLGIKQAELTAEFLKNYEFDTFLCSAMKRTVETAQIINKYQNKKIEFYEEMNEYDETVFEEAATKTDKLDLEINKANAANRFLETLLHNNDGGKLLIITHGNVIRGFLSVLQGLSMTKSPKLNLHPASLTKLIFNKDKLESTSLFNYTDHLKASKP